MFYRQNFDSMHAFVLTTLFYTSIIFFVLFNTFIIVFYRKMLLVTSKYQSKPDAMILLKYDCSVTMVTLQVIILISIIKPNHPLIVSWGPYNEDRITIQFRNGLNKRKITSLFNL